MSGPEVARRPGDDEDMTRLLALSDGLFAIVLTLLVLDLRPASGGGLLTYAGLVELWPQLFGFFLTFLVGGAYWVAHHGDFELIVRRDQRLLWLNLLFLLSVSLLPFTTALIGDHTNSVAWTLYGGDMAAIGLSLAAVWGYADATGLLHESLTPDYRRTAMLHHLVIPAVFAGSIVVTFVNASLAPFVPLLIPVGFRIVGPLTDGGGPGRPRPKRALGWQVLGYVSVIVFGAWTIWLNIHGEI